MHAKKGQPFTSPSAPENAGRLANPLSALSAAISLRHSFKVNLISVIENGRKINSQKLKLPPTKSLKGKNRNLFEIEKIKIDVMKSELINKLG